MPLIITQPTDATDALKRAAARDVLPFALGSREQRAKFTVALREMAVFSARTTNAEYLQRLRTVINSVAQGDMDMGEARVILKQTLGALGYTPEGGFPGDAPVSPAVEGSLQDLRSFRRQDLILRTQKELLGGAGQKMRGTERAAMRQYPAWELVRVISRAVPRNWKSRFQQVGGKLIGGRIIAMKEDPVWAELGSAFDDSLDVDHPPFAYNSGMRWRPVSVDELRELGVDKIKIDGEDTSLDEILDTLPRPKVSTSGLDPDFVKQLKADLKAEETSSGKLTMSGILQGALERSAA